MLEHLCLSTPCSTVMIALLGNLVSIQEQYYSFCGRLTCTGVPVIMCLCITVLNLKGICCLIIPGPKQV